ncbi:hypothetical protein BH09BAC5_BH09BAC5_23420 [soil metagenome]
MTTESSRNHVIIVTYNVDIFTNPTLDLFFKELIRKRKKIVLVAPPQNLLSNYSSQMIFIPVPIFYYGSGSLRSFAGAVKAFFKLARRLKSFKASVLIGVDPLGFVTAGRLNIYLRKKLGYFSFELLFNNEVQHYFERTGDKNYKLLKDLEKEYFNKIDFLMIQDEFRLQSICQENNWVPSKKNLIPVATIPSVNRIIIDKAKLKSELGIPADKKVVVFSGSMQVWTGVDKLLDCVEKNWDDRFWLLFHSRFELGNENEFAERIRTLNAKGFPVSLHNKPFENVDDLGTFLSQCDFGLVIYVPIDHPYAGMNIKEVGLASGKFSMYMMLGLPVIATNCLAYLDLMKEHDFGVLADSISDIPAQLPLLMMNNEVRVQACKQLYEKYLFPENKIKEIVTYLEN